MSNQIDWVCAEQDYLFVFAQLRANAPSDLVALAKAAEKLRGLYEISTCLIGKAMHQYGSLEDEVASAWVRFIIHCLTAPSPYSSFRALVSCQVKATLIDSIRRQCAGKRNYGEQAFSYDENDLDLTLGVVSSVVESAAATIEPADVVEALGTLVAAELISEMQKDLFYDHLFEELSIPELTKKYSSAKPTVYRHINRVAAALRIFFNT